MTTISNKAYNDAIFEYFSTEEHMELAYQISDHIPDIQKTVHRKFWEDISSALTGKVANKEVNLSGWEIFAGTNNKEKPFKPEFIEECLQNKYFQFGIRPAPIPKQEYYLTFCMEQNTVGFKIGYGICWNQEHKEQCSEETLKSVRNIHKEVSNNKIRYDEPDLWWLVLSDFDCLAPGIMKPQSREFTKEMIREDLRKAAATNIIDEFIALFDSCKNHVQKINDPKND